MTPTGYDRVVKGLYVGAKPPYNVNLKPDRIDTLVLCAWEFQPPPIYFPGVEVLRVELNDNGTPIRPQEVRDAIMMARAVYKRWSRGGRVLVTCAQGRNRSGLVAALCLRFSGMSARRAISAIRAARGHQALSNGDFVDLIQRFRA